MCAFDLRIKHTPKIVTVFFFLLFFIKIATLFIVYKTVKKKNKFQRNLEIFPLDFNTNAQVLNPMSWREKKKDKQVSKNLIWNTDLFYNRSHRLWFVTECVFVPFSRFGFETTMCSFELGRFVYILMLLYRTDRVHVT